MKPQDSPISSSYEDSTSDLSLETPETAPSLAVVAPPAGSVQVGTVPPPKRLLPKFHYNKKALTVTAVTLVAVITASIIGGVLIHAHDAKKQALSNAQKIANYGVSNLPLSKVGASSQLQVGETDHLAVNGQLSVGNTLVLTPTGLPSSPTAGQIYYSQTTNTPYYYNGTEFVSLDPGSTAHVSSLQGQTGAVTLGAGSGISINGLTVSNSGVTGLSGTANQVVVSGTTGNISLGLPQDIGLGSTPTFGGLDTPSLTARPGDGGLTIGSGGQNLVLQGASTTLSDSSGGFTNQLVFQTPTGNNTITIPDIGGTICTTANNCASVRSYVSLQAGTPGTADVGNFNISGVGILGGQLDANGGILTNGANINAGAGSITGNGSGLTSLNGSNISSGTVSDARLSGNVALLNGNQSFTGSNIFNGSGAALAVQNASGYNVLSANSTNDTVTLGNVTTVAGHGLVGQLRLADGTSDGFGAIFNTNTLTGNRVISIPDSSGYLCLSNGNCNNAGGPGANASLSNLANVALNVDLVPASDGFTNLGTSVKGFGNLYVADASNTYTYDLTGATTTGNKTITIPSISGSSATLCLDTGNCAGAGSGVTTTGGTVNTIPLYSGTQQIGNSIISQDVGATTATVTGALSVTGVIGGNGSGLTSLNGSNISSGTVANARLVGSGALTVTAGNGLSGGGSVALGGSTTLSAVYGSSANTAVQGNTSLTCASGSGNLSGGGNSVTLGAGGSCNNLTITNSPTFSGTLAVQGSGGITVGSTANTGVINFLDGTSDGFSGSLGLSGALGANQAFTLPSTGGTLCTTTTCIAASGTAGGDLTGTYPNPTIAKLQGKTLTVSTTPATGAVLQYNGSAFVDGLITNTNLQGGTYAAITGTGALASGSIAGGFGTISTGNNITTTAALQGGTATLTGTNALTLGTASSNTGAIVFQGSGGAGTLTLQGPATPNAGNFTLSIPAITANANICTDNSICSGYAPASGSGNYIAKNTNDTSSASYLGDLLGFTNTNTGAAGVLDLNNSGTNSGLYVTQNGTSEPATNRALIRANNLTTSPSGNLLDLATNSVSQFHVDVGGNVTALGAFNGQTISSAASFTGTVNIQGGNALTLGRASSHTGAIVLQGAGGAGTLTLQGPATPNAGNFTLSIPAITANANICTDNSVCAGYAPSTLGAGYIQNGTTLQTGANFAIQSAAAGSVAALIQGAASQTADLLDVKTALGAATALSITSVGITTFKTAGNSLTGFQVQNSSSTTPILDVDTTDKFVGINTGAPTQALALAQSDNISTNLVAPVAPTLIAGTSGQLATSTYYYKITALDGAGGETNIAGTTNESSVSVTGPSGSVQLSWPAILGAVSYRIYRGTSSSGENTFYSSTTNSFTDTGATGAAGTGQNNTTGYINKITANGNSWIDGGNLGIGTSNPQASLQVAGGNTELDGNLNTPFGGLGSYSNLLEYSEQLDQSSVWTAGSNISVTPNATSAPDGQTTAENLTFSSTSTNHTLAQAYNTGSAVGGKTFTFSIWLEANSINTATLIMRTSPTTAQDATTSNYTINDNWQRYTMTKTYAAGDTDTSIQVAILNSTSGNTGSFYAWGAQLEQAPIAGPYVATTTGISSTITSGLVVDSQSVLFRNDGNSTTAFQVQNAAGTNVLSVDTQNSRVGIGAPAANGTLTVGTNTTTASGGIYFGTDTNLYRSAADTLSSNASLILQPTTNTTTAFQVQNAAGGNLLQVDATNSRVTVGQGNLVVTGLSVPAAPTISAGSNQGGTLSGAAGTTYYYKMTALNAAGETFASSEASINGASFTPLVAPTAPTVAVNATAGNLNGSYLYKVTFVTANGETNGGTTSASVSPANQQVNLTAIPTGPTGTTARNIYRTVAGGSDGTEQLVATINDNTTTTYTDNTADGSLGATVPSTDTATTNVNNATVTFTPITGATSYRIYRGTSSGGESAYQTTTTSPFTDTGAAGTSATVPTSDATARLGIGTSSPSTNLQVVGTALFQTPVNTSTAFRILDAGGTSVATVNTSTDTLTVDNLAVTGTCTGCGSAGTVSLQSAYTTGSTITTSGSNNITFNLSSTTSNFVLQNAGTNVLQVSGNNGAITAQNSTNSSTAFVIQNAGGSDNTDNLIDLSSVYNAGNLVTNGSFEQDTTGWAANGSGSITRTNAQSAPFGSQALSITSGAATNNGAKYVVNMTNNTVYSMSFYAKSAAAFSTMDMGFSPDGTTNTTTGCTLTNSPSTTLWLRFTCTFTYTGTTNNGVSYIFIGQNDTTSRTWYVDGVDLEAVASSAFYKEGTLNWNGIALGNTLIQPAANSNVAFQVASVAGATGLLVNTNSSTLTTSFATTISNTATVNTTNVAAFTVHNSTTTANLINADTSTTNNSDTNGGFESSTSTATGYATNHAGVTLTVDTTAGNSYQGNNTGKVVVTSSAVANSGISYNLTTTTMASSTSYTLSFYAKLVAGQSAFTTLTAGAAQNGSTETACTLNSTTVSTAWQRYTCTFTTGTTSGTPYFYIGQTDAGVAHSYYLDNISFIGAGSATANYHEGKIQLNGTIVSPSIFQNNSDGTGVFQVQNAEGNTALNIDTNTGNLVTNSGFENGAGGWNAKNSTNTTLSTDSTSGNVYQGDQSLKATVAAATAGMSTSSFTTTIAASTQYQLTFFAKCDSTYNTLSYGRQDVTGTNIDFTTSGTCTTNWQQYTAHWTTGGTITSPDIYVDLGATTAGSVWIDDVSLIQTSVSAATNYSAGNIELGGVITSPTIFQNSSNSTTALQIQNAGGTSIFDVDTQNQRVGIGTSAPGNLLSIGALTTASAGSQIAVSTGGTSNSGIVIQTVASQSSGYFLQAENSSGTNLASIDYLGNLIVQNATINGHIITGGGALPATTPLSDDGSTGVCTVVGDDTAGSVTITPGGTGLTAGPVCQINFTTAFGVAPRPVIAATNGNASTAQAYVSASATGSFTISFSATVVAQTYTFNWFSPQ